VAAVVAGATVTLAACGGPSGPTASDYASRVNAICRQLATDLQSVGPLPRSFRDPTRQRPQDLPAAASFLDGNVGILRGASTRLHALPMPDGETDLARQWLVAFDTVITDLAGAGDAARRADTQAFTAAAFETAPQAATDRDSLGQKLGIPSCPLESAPPG
jgi:hypothetical protein